MMRGLCLKDLAQVVLLLEEHKRAVAIGKNVKQLCHCQKVKPRKNLPLFCNEIVESFLALVEVLKDAFKRSGNLLASVRETADVGSRFS